MADDARVTELLEKMLDGGLTPEQVCRACPELLPAVRERWKQFARIDADFRALFPEPGAAPEAAGPETADDGPQQGHEPPGTARAAPGLPAIPGYEVQAVLGHGGMGVVYKAWHGRLQRPVALKMLLAGAYAQPEELERFRREAQAVAGLCHANVVQVHDVGDVDGRPYFTMEFVEGGSLAQHIQGVPQPARQAAVLVATLAEAIQAAHQSGIVHRDLKPGNILLTADGTPKVTDFGLARRLQGGPGLTRSGAALGTPSYMAPEQARGRPGDIGPATDVYALGAILYEMLTGRPPFRAETAAATALQVLHEEPVPPTRLNPRVPRDLETICLKCLHKEPSRRYATAADLAADLGRFLRHEPIRARPVGIPGRLLRWARRHPGPAGLTGALMTTALVAFALIVWQWRVAENARGVAEKARGAADRMATRLVLDRGITLCDRGDIGPGLLWFARGLEQAERSRDTDAIPAFRANLIAWSERLVVPRVSPPFGSLVTVVAFHPHGKGLLVARDRVAQVVDPDTWKPLGPPMEYPQGVRAAVFSPDGTRILTGGTEGTVRLWETENGRPVGTPLQLATVTGLAFAPDGERFATATVPSPSTGEARIWDTATGQAVTPALSHHGRVTCVAFSPDGKTLMTGCSLLHLADQPERGEVRFWDSDTGQPVGPVLVLSAPVGVVAFSPDGQTVAAGSSDGLVRRWRRSTWETISPPLHHPSPVRAMVFSPDGRSLLTGNALQRRPKEQECAVRLWDLESGKLLAGPWIHPQDVWSISQSPDGRRVASACADGHVRTFAVGAFQPNRYRYVDSVLAAELWSPDKLTIVGSGSVSATFSPDGRQLLAGGNTPDGREAAGLVDVLTGRIRDLLPDQKIPLTDAVTAAGLSAPPSGGAGLSALGAVLASRPQKSRTEGLAFGLEGKIAVTTARDGKIRLWDVESARLIQGPLALGQNVHHRLTLVPDEHILVTGGLRRPIEIWDRDTGQRVAGPIVGDAPICVTALSPDGRTLATAGEGGIVQLWDARTGQSRTRFDAVTKTIWVLRFSPDGRTLVAGGGRTAWLFDASTGKQRCQPLPHPDYVWEARFSPDGTRLLTICSDEYRDHNAGTVQLWDARSGKPLGPPLAHRVANLAAALDPEGRLVATGGFDGDVRLWDAGTGAAVGPPLVQSGPIAALAFVSGENVLAAAGKEGSLALWPVPEARAGSPTEIRLWVESLTGQKLDETDAVRDLE